MNVLRWQFTLRCACGIPFYRCWYPWFIIGVFSAIMLLFFGLGADL